jgi:hypothetical protein
VYIVPGGIQPDLFRRLSDEIPRLSDKIPKLYQKFDLPSAFERRNFDVRV